MEAAWKVTRTVQHRDLELGRCMREGSGKLRGAIGALKALCVRVRWPHPGHLPAHQGSNRRLLSLLGTSQCP